MTDQSFTENTTRGKVRLAMRNSLERVRPGIAVDGNGSVASLSDNLLPGVEEQDFFDDFRKDREAPLEDLHVAHSSRMLAINCFAPFTRRVSEPRSSERDISFDEIRFERDYPIWARGEPSILNVVLSGPGGVIGVESNLAEYLTYNWPEFPDACEERIRDVRRNGGYFKEMLRLKSNPDLYYYLDAARLIKQALGMARAYFHQRSTLLYLYWEPTNAEAYPEFARHRGEVVEFAERVSSVEGTKPGFLHMSYPELFDFWEKNQPAGWLVEHLRNFRDRYEVEM